MHLWIGYYLIGNSCTFIMILFLRKQKWKIKKRAVQLYHEVGFNTEWRLSNFNAYNRWEYNKIKSDIWNPLESCEMPWDPLEPPTYRGFQRTTFISSTWSHERGCSVRILYTVHSVEKLWIGQADKSYCHFKNLYATLIFIHTPSNVLIPWPSVWGGRMKINVTVKFLKWQLCIGQLVNQIHTI